MEPNYYLVLGVKPDATAAEIQEAYRRLARLYHPDVSGADTAGKFQELQQAYEVLGNTQQRHDYDARRPGRRRSPPPGTAPPARDSSAWEEAGEELHLELQMTAAEAARGGEVPVELPRMSPCPFCGGRGQRFGFLCRTCRGSGHGLATERFLLHIPPGLTSGDAVRIPLRSFGLLHGRLVVHVRVVSC